MGCLSSRWWGLRILMDFLVPPDTHPHHLLSVCTGVLELMKGEMKWGLDRWMRKFGVQARSFAQSCKLETDRLSMAYFCYCPYFLWLWLSVICESFSKRHSSRVERRSRYQINLYYLYNLFVVHLNRLSIHDDWWIEAKPASATKYNDQDESSANCSIAIVIKKQADSHHVQIMICRP